MRGEHHLGTGAGPGGVELPPVVALRFNVDLPPIECSPNGRVHVRTRRRANDAYRDYVALVARSAMNEWPAPGWVTPTRARLELCFHLREEQRNAPIAQTRYHPRDADNALASAKGLIDGLRLAQAILEDSWPHLEIGRLHASHVDGPWVEVTVKPLVLVAGPA